jgi:hypothetical protein
MIILHIFMIQLSLGKQQEKKKQKLYHFDYTLIVIKTLNNSIIFMIFV